MTCFDCEGDDGEGCGWPDVWCSCECHEPPDEDAHNYDAVDGTEGSG